MLGELQSPKRVGGKTGPRKREKKRKCKMIRKEVDHY
jgi:hypothetical protein